MSMRQTLRTHKIDLITGLALVLVLWGAYFVIGEILQSSATLPFRYYDIFFEMDVPRVMGDMLDFNGDHVRTSLHPIYVLLVNPLGAFLLNIPNAAKYRFAIAILMNAGIGSMSALAAYVFFRFMGGKCLQSLLISLIFGSSMGQIMFSSVPETIGLAVLSVIATFAVFWVHLYHRKLGLSWWFLVGLFSAGITLSNFMQTLICFVAAHAGQPRMFTRRFLVKVVAYIILVFTALSVLALIQKTIYPSSSLFFIPNWVQKETRYLNSFILMAPLPLLAELLKQMAVVNLVGVNPAFSFRAELLPATTFFGSWIFFPVGYMALAVLTMLLILNNTRSHYLRYKRFYAALFLCVAFNILFHALYGLKSASYFEFFLYSGSVGFSLILLLFTKYLVNDAKASRVLLTVLWTLLALNNGLVLQRIIKMYNSMELVARAEGGWSTINPRWEALEEANEEYNSELNELWGGQISQVSNAPSVKFMLFGMGNRPKFVYQDGAIRELTTRRIVKRWHTSYTMVVPCQSTVATHTFDNYFVFVWEDESGIHYEENGKTFDLYDAHDALDLPDFSSYTYPFVMQELLREILINIDERQPFTNLLVDAAPRADDVRIIEEALWKTGQSSLIEHKGGPFESSYLSEWNSLLNGDSRTQTTPYLLLAQSRFSVLRSQFINPRTYPLTWEKNVQGIVYNRMCAIDPLFAAAKIALPNARQAAEILLMLYADHDRAAAVSSNAASAITRSAQ